jgi:hypothetical protein
MVQTLLLKTAFGWAISSVYKEAKSKFLVFFGTISV